MEKKFVGDLGVTRRGDGGYGELGHGAAGLFERRKKTVRKKAPRCRLYPPEMGSPDALNVAPDTSGDHRTKT